MTARTLAALLAALFFTPSLALSKDGEAKFIVEGYVDGKDEKNVHAVRGLDRPVRIGYTLYELDGLKIFFFEYALPSAVAQAEKEGWLAREWMIGSGGDPVTDLEPLALSGIPWRPVGTFVRLRSGEWNSLPCEGYEERITYVLRLLVPASVADASIDTPLPSGKVAGR